MKVDGQNISDSDRLRILREEEVFGERSPQAEEAAITRYEEVRDSGRFMQVRSLTPEKLRHMSSIERRLLREWIVKIADEFDAKAALIDRNLPATELAVPDYYMEKAV